MLCALDGVRFAGDALLHVVYPAVYRGSAEIKMARTIAFVFLLLLPLPSLSRDSTFTFHLRPGRIECFYEYVHEGALLEVEYQVSYKCCWVPLHFHPPQVISGGELDINFFITGPDGLILASDERKLDALKSVDVKETGEHAICLDNSFSHVSEKLVFMDIIIEDDAGESIEEKNKQQLGPDIVKSMEMDMKLYNLSVS